jgi:hypothetical protein
MSITRHDFHFGYKGESMPDNPRVRPRRMLILPTSHLMAQESLALCPHGRCPIKGPQPSALTETITPFAHPSLQSKTSVRNGSSSGQTLRLCH